MSERPTLPAVIPHALFLAAFASLMAVITWQITPQVLEGSLRDTDDYTRLVLVRQLAESGAWFDSSIPRSNWPYGETLHWTRPVDVLLIAVAGPFVPWLGVGRALHLAAIVVPPGLLLATCFTIGWAGRVFFGPEGTWLTMIAVLAQPAVLAYGLPGRADHHIFILLTFAFTLAFSLRALVEPERRSWSYAAGAVAGVGFWSSTEFLLPLAVLLAVPVVAWISEGGDHGLSARRWVASFAVATSAALVLERGPDLFAVAYDQISIVHLLMALLALAFWLVAVAFWRSGRVDRLRTRLLVAIGGGIVCLGTLRVIFPTFFGGPFVEVEHPVVREWLGRVSELQPTLTPTDATRLGFFLANAGAVLVAGPYVLNALRRSGGKSWAPWLLMATLLVVFLPTALAQIRWVTYVQLVIPILLARFVLDVRAVAHRRLPHRLRVPMVVSVALAVLVGPLVLGALVLAAVPEPDGGSVAGRTFQACDYTVLARHLGTDHELSSRARTVAAIMDAGPAILYFTDHRVLATPYHRNVGGIVASHELVNASDDGAARALAAERQVDLILLCPAREVRFFVPTTASGDTTLYGRLLDGRPPDWLEPVALPPHLQGALLFQVVEPPSAAPDGSASAVPR